MISIDAYLLEFVKGNWMTLTMLYMILRGIAKVSPWKWDEVIVDTIASAFDVFRPVK